MGSKKEFYNTFLFEKIGLSSPTISIEDILYSKQLASLGDALVNYCYSVARMSINPKLMTGVRVWDSSLAMALRQSPFNSFIKRRISQGSLGDCVEAIVGWVYMNELMSLEEIITLLKNNLPAELLKNKMSEKDGATFAFIALLEQVYKIINIDKESQ